MKCFFYLYFVLSFENSVANEFRIHSQAVDSGKADSRTSEAFKNQKCIGKKCEVIFPTLDEEEIIKMKKNMKKRTRNYQNSPPRK